MPQIEPKHIRWADVPVEHLNPLLDRQFVVGEGIMIARILLRNGCLVPEHSHYHEQVTQVLSGSLRFVVDGTEVIIHAGEGFITPPHAVHSAFALEDTVAIDTFTPPREDWINKTDAYLR
jgi:quercetin dioxygenase-like cupin family protein